MKFLKQFFYFCLIMSALIVCFSFTPAFKRWQVKETIECFKAVMKNPQIKKWIVEKGSTVDEIMEYLNNKKGGVK